MTVHQVYLRAFTCLQVAAALAAGASSATNRSLAVQCMSDVDKQNAGTEYAAVEGLKHYIWLVFAKRRHENTKARTPLSRHLKTRAPHNMAMACKPADVCSLII